uniref:SUN domain-containing protein n=1 Tax=Strigamia maritima TaxID=126957 RepID=T1IRF0_STRMM
MSRTMKLRSSCRGDCSPVNDSGNRTPDTHNHHNHHHHHHHTHLESEKDSDLTSKLKDISKKATDLVEDLRGTLSKKKGNSVSTVTSWSIEKNTSTVKSIKVPTLPSPIAVSSPVEGKVTVKFSRVKTPPGALGGHSSYIISSINGTQASVTSRNVSKYSDYSSGDELDFDYSTSRHSPDTVPFPNMSRPPLNSGAYGSTSSYFKSPYEAMGFEKCYESDAEDRNNFAYKNNNYYRQDAKTEYQTRNDIRRLSFVDCVVPLTTIWKKFWSIIYWVISSVLLLDSWMLSRRRVGKKWIFLPLLLLLLFLLLGLFTQSSKTTFEGATFAAVEAKNAIYALFMSVLSFTSHCTEAVYLTAGSFFAYFQANKTNESVVPSSLPSSAEKYFVPQKTDINEIHANFQAQLSHEQVEKIVRSIVGEEMMHLTLKMRQKDDIQGEQNMLQTQTFEVHKQSLSVLNTQIQGILEQQKTLSDQLRLTKDRLASSSAQEQSVNSDSIVRIRNLEMEMHLLKNSIAWLQENQAALEASMRNCCRNNTFDPAVVENQVAAILLQVMGQQSNSGAMRSEFEGFTQWLKSSLISDVEKVSSETNAETMKRAEAVARLAAAAAVRDTLKQQEDRLGSVQFAGKLSETEVRKIVHDAIAIYDADKTGLTDYALESSGGSILSTRCSETYEVGNAQVTWFGIPFWTQSNSPRTVIQPEVRPGECWAFKGSEGYLVIKLMGWVQPTAFSLEHIPRSVAPNGNIDSAPKEFSVYGLTQENDLDGVLIGRFVYNIDRDSLQYFAVPDPNMDYFPIVELRIHSNHGNLVYTCLYRFRVHGRLGKPE